MHAGGCFAKLHVTIQNQPAIGACVRLIAEGLGYVRNAAAPTAVLRGAARINENNLPTGAFSLAGQDVSQHRSCGVVYPSARPAAHGLGRAGICNCGSPTCPSSSQCTASRSPDEHDRQTPRSSCGTRASECRTAGTETLLAEDGTNVL